MVQSLKVLLWGEEIGRLAWDARRRLSYFMYNPAFLKKGLNIFPLVAPIDGMRGLTPIWGEEAKIYQKLPAFIADSLPDAWGNQLFDLWRQQNHLPNADITPLDKLSFIGKRGMGALEFLPEVSRERKAEKIDIDSLANLAERIFTERENVRILPEESITMQSLLTVGTSAGGRQPKAIVAINRKDGEVRSGQIAGLENFDYYLIKFGNSQYSSAELEMAYYELATMAGIHMMPSELYLVDGNSHFMTKRFDRKGGKNNTDDHNKNFAFVMSEDGSWRLSPAYDITYIFDNGGFLPNEEHCMYVRAKLRDITRDDVIQFAKDNGIRRPDAIIRDVVNALKQFRAVATKYGVAEQWVGRVETTIVDHLKSWGELEEIAHTTCEFVINGHVVKNMRMEQAYKGNFHLLAEIDGRERKFVIGKNKEEFSLIESIGIANLSLDQLKDMTERYLRLQI